VQKGEHGLVYFGPVVFFFVLGLILIIKGADWFVESAVWMADMARIPKVIMGATVVSFATTLPELVVSSFASWDGHPGIAIGNPIGSTICNIGLILGVCCLIKPYYIERSFFIYKGSTMLGIGFLMLYLLKDNTVDRAEGIALLALLLLYIVLNLIESIFKKDLLPEIEVSTGNWIINVIKFIIGAVCVMSGAKLSVDNGVILAQILGVPERVISLTLIAIGTSLPELITSFAATMKGYQGISIGNILGANILNLLMVIGMAATINPLKIAPQVKIFDMPYSLFLMMVLLLSGIIDSKIERWVAVFLLVIYISYIIILGVIFFD
jgi:cation:H+ antiporter